MRGGNIERQIEVIKVDIETIEYELEFLYREEKQYKEACESVQRRYLEIINNMYICYPLFEIKMVSAEIKMYLNRYINIKNKIQEYTNKLNELKFELIELEKELAMIDKQITHNI